MIIMLVYVSVSWLACQLLVGINQGLLTSLKGKNAGKTTKI